MALLDAGKQKWLQGLSNEERYLQSFSGILKTLYHSL